jgi:hypothetical protein
MASPAQQVQTDRQIARVISRAPQAIGEDDDVLEPTTRGERMTRFDTPGWSRMRRSWNAEDRIEMDAILGEADRLVQEAFPVAFALMERIYETVRSRAADELGQPLLGPDRWEKTPDGLPREDWTRVLDSDSRDWLDTITMHLFEWEQQQARMWGEAMFAKGRWEETFARFYEACTTGSTVDDKTQFGQRHSMESRYFGIFKGLVSRQADALVRSMVRIQGVLEKNVRAM